ncbi:LysR substrate-binding domain-containing protein [Dactylosporangium sp. McL0621]|uniref:LysR substrate-binding domain-containing protein n=1 Tax=Dactylosporangium sp. McL0621 TaxID=3415678 RepID=UPI003CEB08BF
MPLPPTVTDLTSFDLLLSVARLGSVGRAAVAHGMSQPAASARLRQLERRLGVTLLDRGPRGSSLTETGALIADWARVAVDAADALAAGIAALRASRHSRLTVAASQTVAEYLLPAWLVALHAGSPGLSVTLRALNSADVAARVLAGEADLGFVEAPAVPAGLDAAPVGADRLTVIVAPGHPWARRRRGITAAELAATPLVSREAGSGTRGALEAALAAAPPVSREAGSGTRGALEAALPAAPPVSREAGSGTRGALEAALPAAAPAPLLELSSTTAIKHAVAAGNAPGVVSSLAIVAELAAGTLVAVPAADVPLQRRLHAVWPAGRQLTGPARDLLAIARRR